MGRKFCERGMDLLVELGIWELCPFQGSSDHPYYGRETDTIRRGHPDEYLYRPRLLSDAFNGLAIFVVTHALEAALQDIPYMLRSEHLPELSGDELAQLNEVREDLYLENAKAIEDALAHCKKVLRPYRWLTRPWRLLSAETLSLPKGKLEKASHYAQLLHWMEFSSPTPKRQTSQR